MSSFGNAGIINWSGGVDYALLENNLAWLHARPPLPGVAEGKNTTLPNLTVSPFMKWANSPCGDKARQHSERPPRLGLAEFIGQDADGEEDGFIWIEWFFEDCIDPQALSAGFSSELVIEMKNEKYPVLVITQPFPPDLQFGHEYETYVGVVEQSLTRFIRELHRANLLQGIGQPRVQKSNYESWVVCLDSKVNAMILNKLLDAPSLSLDKEGNYESRLYQDLSAAKGRKLTFEFLKETVGNAGLMKMEKGGK